MHNTIMFCGEAVDIGPTPVILRELGFEKPGEVRAIAARCSQGEPFMRMDDVAEWFKSNVH